MPKLLSRQSVPLSGIMGAQRRMKPKPVLDYREVYQLRDQAEISRFLKRHGFLRSLLSDVYQAIQDHFPRSPVFLRVATDPEEGDQTLVVSVGTALEPAEALSQLRRFKREWWLNSLHRAQGKLLITLEYI